MHCAVCSVFLYVAMYMCHTIDDQDCFGSYSQVIFLDKSFLVHTLPYAVIGCAPWST